MIFVALLATLRSSSGRMTSSHELAASPPQVSDLIKRVLPSYEGQASGQTGRPHGQYALASMKNREGEEMLRVTLWGEHASDDAAALISSLVHHPFIVVGPHRYTVQSVSLLRRPWVSLATWTDLLVSRNDRVLRLHFVTPTTFQEPSADEHPGLDFPEPAVMFSQLLKRWTSIGGPPLTTSLLSFLEQNGCMAADYRLHTRHHVLPCGIETGWVGWVLYECRTHHPESIAAINSLARLACLTGTGFATEHGMGFTRLIHPQERR